MLPKAYSWLFAICALAATVSAQQPPPECPDPCLATKDVHHLGSLPPGATLVFELINLQNGNGTGVTDQSTGATICATCTPCRATLPMSWQIEAVARQSL